MSDKKLTAGQQQLVKELVAAHGLEPDQISFDGTESTPIFDYEAVNALSLKLTDITNIDTYISERGEGFVKSRCLVELPDGRTRKIEESAYLGEPLGEGGMINDLRLAEQVAQARAVRRGIRSVGVNLFNAHKKYMETGETVSGHTDHDPRYPQYQEINVLAYKLGIKHRTKISGKTVEEREEYEKLLAQNFAGKTSAKDLDDLELQRFIIILRSFVRLQNSRQNSAPKAA